MTRNEDVSGSIDDIKSDIEAVVREHIHSGEIVRVIVEASDDPDDGLMVRVIFHARKNKLDAAETSQLARHVWTRLIDLGINRFPYITFIAKSEAGDLAAA